MPAIAVLKSRPKSGKIPLKRRSSVHRAKPFLMASAVLLLRISLPFSVTVPLSRVRAPNSVSSSSVRPAPSRPAMPRTSPSCRSKEISWMWWPRSFKSFTTRISLPMVPCFGGKRSVSSRPTIRRMTSSTFVSAARIVLMSAPSRMTVISSAMRKISSILWEM